jgi:pyruvate dehydrogenase (quinone)
LRMAQESTREWWELLRERAEQKARPMKPEVVAWHLQDLLDDDAIITGDSGAVTTWIARLRLRGRQRFSFSGTLCSMAAALPYAIGAQSAFPGRQVVAFTGDGSMSMMLGDLATLAQHNLPVKVIVMKNNSLSLIEWEQMLYLGNPEYGVDLMPIDFVKVAEGCGAKAIRIDDPETCREQLKSALALEGPVLIEAVVDPHEPPQPPKISHDEVKHLAAALARGEENRVRIGLTIGRQMLDEATLPASPFGALGRFGKKLGVVGSDSDASRPDKDDEAHK